MTLSSFAASAKTFIWKDFTDFKTEYFAKLDYFVPHIAKDIPSLERKLIAFSEEILAKPEHAQTKEDANFLAYTALYILNTKGGFFAGTISQSDFDQTQTFTSSKNLQDIHLARHQHVVKLLEDSNRIDPKHRLDDKRELQKFVTYFGSKKMSDDDKAQDPHKLDSKTTLKIMSCAACHSSPKAN